MTTDVCRNGHRIRGPQDRLQCSGNCRRCDRDAGARYRQKCRDALAIVRTMQAVSI